MAQHDNDPSPAPDRSHALVETKPASAPQGANLAMPSPFAFGAPQGQDVLRGGMDRSGLWHSLRRRWLLATSMGLLLGSTAGALLYFLLPETYSARAQYKVAADPMTLLDASSANQTRDFDIYKNTQIASIKSQWVLNDALDEPGVSQLSIFDGVDDKVDWLFQHLDVAFPNDGELLTIELSGPYPKEELKKVVDAVSKAYYEQVVFYERGIRTQPLQILTQSYGKLDSQVRDKLVAYQELAKQAGTSESYRDGFDPETTLMLTEVNELQKRQSQLEAKLAEASMSFRIFERQINDPAYQDSMVSKALEDDPYTVQLQQQLMLIEMQARSLGSTVKNGSSPAIRRMEQERDNVARQIEQRRSEMRAQIAGQQSNEPNPMLKAESVQFQVISAMIGQELGQVKDRLTRLQEELRQKAENNTDLIIRLSEIEQLRKVQQGMAQKIQNLAVELEAPDRITALGARNTGEAVAATSENRNRYIRLALAGLGSLGAAALTCLGIGYMEFNNRRLNSPEQVDEGLGIRVVGTLPALSGGRALNPRHPVVAQLNESIDNIRTALMHESTSKRRRIVLVASAATMEGRTTVASQLAASLARAGRRTLLVDGDLRRPSLHTLFNVPLEDGLCEVLRAENEVTDVIHATQAEGLWLMTAGYCDGDAVQALATEQVQPIFDQLRSDYDFVIVDGAPVLGLPDSLLLGQQCDGVILSVLRDHSNVPQVHKAAETLRSVGVRVIGAVVNGVKTKADRRVTHLTQVTPKSSQAQLEEAGA